jgi:hypothetical protein
MGGGVLNDMQFGGGGDETCIEESYKKLTDNEDRMI